MATPLTHLAREARIRALPAQPGAGPPERRQHDELERQVRDALLHLFDPIYLQRHPLTRLVAASGPPRDPRATRGAALRNLLLEAIEALRPDARVPADSRAARGYRLLHLRYVEARQPVEVQDDLALGKSQYYVEHERALEALISLLAERHGLAQAVHPAPLAESERRVHGHVPSAAGAFVGRREELDTARQLISEQRLITITGPAGVGKTRFAFELACGNGGHVCWVDVSSARSTDEVFEDIADALGVSENAPALATKVIEHLQGQWHLLVMDGAGPAVCNALAQLLAGGAGLRVLVTSEHPMGVPSERVWTLAGLSLEPESQCDAAKLLDERSATSLWDGQAVSVCRALGGLPLAIELVAAAGPAAHADAAALCSSAGDGAAVTTAVIDWAWRRQAGAQQGLLESMAVFDGGCDREAAQTVGDLAHLDQDAAAEVLDRLTIARLLAVDHTHANRRYLQHEAVKSHGLQRLSERGASADGRMRHLEYFRDVAEQHESTWRRELRHSAWFRHIESERLNIRGALDWSAENGLALESGLRLASSLWWYWWICGQASAGRQRLGQLLAAAQRGPEQVRPAPAVKAKALVAAGVLGLLQNDFDGARSLLEEALALGLELGERDALAVIGLGLVSHYVGDPQVARSFLEEALAIGTRAGDNAVSYLSLHNLGLVAQSQADYDRAEALDRQGLALARRAEESGIVAASLHRLGSVMLDKGDPAAARAAFQESLALRLGPRGQAAAFYSMEGLASLAANEGQFARGMRLAGISARMRDRCGATLPIAQQAQLDAQLEAARQALGEQTAMAEWARGWAMPLDEAVDYALAEDPLAAAP